MPNYASGNNRPNSGYPSNQRPSNGGYGRGQDETPPLDVSKMVFGDTLDPNIYADVAESIAKAIGDDKRNAVKSTQARRFYDEVVMWEEKIRQNPASFAENLPLIKMMKAKVAYAKGRKHIDAGFERMMNTGLNQVVCPKTLTQFKTFFEAFMGFYKVYGPK